MKISALIPTYNRRAKVLRAIESVLAQTVPVDEIIVVDDGSTDGTAEAIRSRYGSRIVLFQQENKGVSAARNHGIRESHGEWIALLDSDDAWQPTKTERQLEALAAFGDEFGLCFTDCVFVGDPDLTRSVFEENGLENAPPVGALEDPARYIVADRFPFWTQSLLIRRHLLGEIGGFNETLTIREDTDVIFRLSFKTRFCFVGSRLVEIDRAQTRTDGLCNLYGTRNDLKYNDLRRLLAGWLTMPEVAGSAYERSILRMLRLVHYDSAECKIHQLRLREALREFGRLRALGDSYRAMVGTLISRKMVKLRRDRQRADHTEVARNVGGGLDLS